MTNKELNCWIAEHVFGFEWWHADASQSFSRRNILTGFTDKIQTKEAWLSDIEGPRPGKMPGWTDSTGQVPSYSDHIYAALPLWEKCVTDLEVGVIKLPDGFWLTSLTKEGRELGVKADTFPMAVALFAKQLFGGEQ